MLNKVHKEYQLGRCMLVSNGIVRQKGRPSIEFYKNGKPQYYCMGYENKMTDEAYHECRECPRWALGEQTEKDYEDAKKNGLLSK